MKVLVTGSRGKVGRALCPRLAAAGYDVRATDLALPTWDRVDPGEPEDYWQADLTDAGAAYALARDCDAIVHTAAIPQPIHNPPHVVFGNNIMSTFNVLEAAIAAGVRRFVNFSSETVPGFIFAERPFEPDYLPIDEEHPFGRRIRTRPRSGSASSSAIERPSAPTSGAPRSVRAGSRTREATSATSARSSEIRPCSSGTTARTSTSTTSVTRSCSPSRPTSRVTRSSTSPRPTRSAATRSSRR